MNREDFPILNKDFVYLDSSATSLKPTCVVDSMMEYYTSYTSNIHRGDYDFAIKTNQIYDDTRKVVADFVNCSSDEVIFTSGATMSINMVAFGFIKKYLKYGDEILITKSEHASNVLPWMKLVEEIGVKLKYIELNDDYTFSIPNFINSITPNTKLVSIAHITNVIGDVRDILTVGKICDEKNILFHVDAAQSISHVKTDFTKCKIDFLSFSGHKMLGPTGIGVLVARKKYIPMMDPLCYGGGMNVNFSSENKYQLKEGVLKLEGGTPPIAEVIGLRQAILYLEKVGIENIHNHEIKLKKHLVNELKKIPNIKMYNQDTDSGILIFNINGVFAQDSSIFLNHYKICVRAGNHCTKMLNEVIGVKNTVRVSLHLYNNLDDINRLIDALKKSEDIFKVVL